MKKILTAIKVFIAVNQVFVSGLLSALILVLQQFQGEGPLDPKALGTATLLAIIGVVANNFKGKGITVVGILGTLAGVFQTIHSTGTFTLNEFILSSAIALLLAVMKTVAPEHVPTPEKTPSAPQAPPL